jgi:hypothetical protein
VSAASPSPVRRFHRAPQLSRARRKVITQTPGVRVVRRGCVIWWLIYDRNLQHALGWGLRVRFHFVPETRKPMVTRHGHGLELSRLDRPGRRQRAQLPCRTGLWRAPGDKLGSPPLIWRTLHPVRARGAKSRRRIPIWRVTHGPGTHPERRGHRRHPFDARRFPRSRHPERIEGGSPLDRPSPNPAPPGDTPTENSRRPRDLARPHVADHHSAATFATLRRSRTIVWQQRPRAARAEHSRAQPSPPSGAEHRLRTRSTGPPCRSARLL